jgi:hypothetical protein
MRERGVRIGSRPWDLVALAVAVAICSVTLVPVGPGDSATELGMHGPTLADALRNLVLFAPLGAALALGGHGPRRIAVWALALSASIEVVQLAIPGRWTALGDLIANTAGASGACALILARSWWLAPPPGTARALCALAALAVWVVPALTGYLFAPDLPAGQYYGGWTPQVGDLAIYPGRVLEARIGGVDIPVGGPAPDSASLRRALVAREPILLRWQMGAPPARLAPLVLIGGPDSEEVALIGVRRSDVLMRSWRRSARLLLEQPEWIWPGALANLHLGEIASLRVTPVRGGALLSLDGRSERRARSGPGHGWALLGRDRWVPIALRPWFDALWLAVLCFPLGLWLPSGGWGAAIAAASLAGLALVPPAFGLASASLSDGIAALLGAIAGRAVRVWPSAAR